MKKRFLAGLLALCIVAALLPTAAFAAGNEPDMQFGAEGLGTDDIVYFGATSWYVWNTEGLLLSQYLFGAGVYFDSLGLQKYYGVSDLKTNMANLYGSLFPAGKNGAPAERDAIASTTLKSASMDSSEPDLKDQKLFPLSCDEIPGPVNMGDSKLMAKSIGDKNGGNCSWWLRTTIQKTKMVYCMDEGGSQVTKNGYTQRAYVRPAFNLNMDAVLFISAASGGKTSGNLGAGALAPVSASGVSEWKLTLKDKNRSFAAQTTAINGSMITVRYSGASVGGNEYISAIVKGSDNVIKYYGRIVQPETAEGTLTVKLSGITIAEGDTLQLFSEQCNGDQKTDYASAPVVVVINASEIPDVASPVLSAGTAKRTGILSATVRFTSDEAGAYYYAVVESGAEAPEIDTSAAGTSCGTNRQTISLSGLTAGGKDIYIAVKDAAGNVSDSLKIAVPEYTAPTGSTPSVRILTNGIAAGDTVYFGQYTEEGTAYNVPWLVLGSDVLFESTAEAGKSVLPLLSKHTLGTSALQEGSTAAYNGCTLQTAMTAIYEGFTATEQSMVVDTTLSGATIPESNDLAGQKLFPMSGAASGEYYQIFYNKNTGMLQTTSITPGGDDSWWLRQEFVPDTEGTTPMSHVYVTGDGGTGSGNSSPTSVHGVRPAFHLDQSKILFNSSADNKGHYTGLTKADTELSDGSFKLTFADGNNFSADTMLASGSAVLLTGYEAETLNFYHKKLSDFGAAGYTNVTAALIDDEGTLLYYGSINSNTGAKSSSVTIPAGLASGTYTLSLYGEQWNAANTSNYATGTPFTMDITVLAEPVTTHSIQLGINGISGVTSITEYDNIYFGSLGGSPIKWRVLDDRTNTGKAGFFLLSEYLLGSEKVVYNSDNTADNVWQSSNARIWCVNFAANNFSDTERAEIIATTKSDAEYTSKTQFLEIEGDTKLFAGTENILNGDKVFFLSVEESQNYAYGFVSPETLSPEVQQYVDNMWWLRSSYKIDKPAGVGVGSGNILTKFNADHAFPARPAFNLSSDNILFISSAEGGKSAAGMSGGLTTIPSLPSREWKLTLSDAEHSSFSAKRADGKSAVTAGNTVSITYSNAQAGDNEYISAMIVKDGEALYYGRIAASSEGTSNTIDVTIPIGLAGGEYTLQVFNEQYNGDYLTDYASEPASVPITVNAAPIHTITATAESGGTISPSGNVTVNAGENKSFTISANTEYIIDDVKVDGSSVKTQISGGVYTFTNVTEDHTIAATFSYTGSGMATHTITATAESGGTILPSGNVTVNAGENKSFTVAANEGYIIDDVKVDGSSVKTQLSGGVYTFTNVTEDHTIAATFSYTGSGTTTYALTVTKGTGDGNYLEGKPVSIVADNAPVGQRFKSWQLTSGSGTFANVNSASTTFTMSSGAATVTATYESIPAVSNTVTVNGSYSSNNGTGSYSQGEIVTIRAGSRDRYSFAGWTVLSGGVTLASPNSATTTFIMPGDKAVTVRANWAYNGQDTSGDYYTITTSAGEGGEILPSGSVSVREGRDETFTIMPETGYAIFDVLVDGVSVKSQLVRYTYTFKNVQRGHTIRATFKQESEVNPNTGAGNPLTDAKDAGWFFEDVMSAHDSGFMLDTGYTGFSPYNIATYAIMETMLRTF